MRNRKLMISLRIIVPMVVLGFIIVSLMGCTEKNEIIPDEVPETEQKEKIEVGKDDIMADITITWVVPQYQTIDRAVLREFNKLLAEEGYNFALQIVGLDIMNYSESLRKYLEAGRPADIVNTGISAAGSYQLIDSGQYIRLNEYLNSEEGAELFDIYAPVYWEAGKVKEIIYTIPYGAAEDLSMQFIFNRNIITDEMMEDFDGTIAGLWNMIQEYQLNPADFPVSLWTNTEYLYNLIDADELYGVLLSREDKRAYNPFEHDEFIDMMQIFHELYQQGFLNESFISGTRMADSIVGEMEEGEFGVLITTEDFKELKDNEDVGVVKTTAHISSRLTASNGVLAQSEHQDEALKLLTLAYTDSRFANLLIYGQEEKDYVVEDGRAVLIIDGEKLYGADSFHSNVMFGIYENTYSAGTENNYIGEDGKTGKKAYYMNHVESSSFMGFHFNPDGFEDKLEIIWALVSANLDVWMAEDFEEAVQAAADSLRAAGIDEIIVEINRQLGAD